MDRAIWFRENMQPKAGRTILLVDDDDDDHEIFLTALEAVSPESKCHIAFNGKQALDQLLGNKVKPDVIFLDLNMPLMNGQEFLKAIKLENSLKHIPVVILSTASDTGIIRETLTLGATNFITKPDRFDLWEQALKAALESRSSNI